MLLALMGAGFMVQMAGTNTLLQLRVPEHLRGRVMSLHSALFLGVFPNHGTLWIVGDVHVLDWTRASVRLLFPSG